ncbi:WD40-repeat-containing domain protein, partial [Jimgerdemannia flammicorona]
MTGHRGNVKCIEFVGEEGRSIASGSSDNTLRIWDTETSAVTVLEGHTSRIWDASSTKAGGFVASASGDGNLWELKGAKPTCAATLTGHCGDVYSVKFHPSESHVATGGYDKVVRLFDVNTGTIVKTFSGHQLSVSKTIFNPLGNLIERHDSPRFLFAFLPPLTNSSKDNTIKFWDIVSGLCIRTITSHLGEVTSVEMNASGMLLLSSSKDNSNRLWDVRTVSNNADIDHQILIIMEEKSGSCVQHASSHIFPVQGIVLEKPIRKLKGHQNTSKNFIRAGFAHSNLIVGGSEDGIVYIWDQETGEVLQKLRGHDGGPVYSAVWNNRQSLLASCGDDRTVRTWCWREDGTFEQIPEVSWENELYEGGEFGQRVDEVSSKSPPVRQEKVHTIISHVLCKPDINGLVYIICVGHVQELEISIL